MKPRWITASFVAATLALHADVGRAGDSCPAPCTKPPSNSRYLSTPGPVPLPLLWMPLLSASPAIKVGKPKRVLVVEATVSTSVLALAAPTGIGMYVDVNGVAMEAAPPPFGYVVDCGISGLVPPPLACTVNGSFWLDLDQNPGLIGVPLAVTLLAGELIPFGPVTGAPVVASMAIRLEKK